ncbi:MAG: hypothetical protein CL666_04675 [Balneola sp.]|nr:hypothetical protein [Balneola sp.]|tara:strand:+ start:43174 stop:43476 length:303 start_codon:yes stop_codon:yes gene_type:complete
MISIPKVKKIRSKKITQFAKGQRCTLRVADQCSGNDTVVFCHAPSMGKGEATKSDDFWGAFGCYACHQLADAGKITGWDWMKAIYETMKILFEHKLLKAE